MIGGRNVKVLKVMVCNEDWLERNYYRPWKNLFELYDQYKRSQTRIVYYIPPPPPPEPVYTPPKRINTFSSMSYEERPVIRKKKESNECGCSCILF